MHNEEKELTSKKHKKESKWVHKEQKRKLLFDQEEIAARWVEYITELYDDH